MVKSKDNPREEIVERNILLSGRVMQFLMDNHKAHAKPSIFVPVHIAA